MGLPRRYKRANIDGRLKGGTRRRRDRTDGVSALLGRLRRLEVVVLHLTMKLTLSEKEFDTHLKNMLDLKDVKAPDLQRRRTDEGSSLSLPYEGPLDGEVEDDHDPQ